MNFSFNHRITNDDDDYTEVHSDLTFSSEELSVVYTINNIESLQRDVAIFFAKLKKGETCSLDCAQISNSSGYISYDNQRLKFYICCGEARNECKFSVLLSSKDIDMLERALTI